MRPREQDPTGKNREEAGTGTGTKVEVLADEINTLFRKSPRDGVDLLFRSYAMLLAATIWKSGRQRLSDTEVADALCETTFVLVKRVYRWEESKATLPDDIVKFAFGVAKKIGLQTVRQKSRRREQQMNAEYEIETPITEDGLGYDGVDISYVVGKHSSIDRMALRSALKDVLGEFEGLKRQVVSMWFSMVLNQQEGPSDDLKMLSERELSRMSGLSRRQVGKCLRQAAALLKARIMELSEEG